MKSKLQSLYTAAQVRELDRLAIEEEGMPGFTLMQRAGARCFNELTRAWPEASRLTICCGPGNNGGDGYVVAALALQAGLEVHLIQMGDAERIQGDAALARQAFIDAGGIEEAWGKFLPDADVLVDALLGTGLQRPVEGYYLACIRAMNHHGAPILSVDIPSGIHADTGSPMGGAVKADIVVTFIGAKQGLYTGRSLDYRKEIFFDDLGVPDAIYRSVEPSVRLLLAEPGQQLLPARPLNAHKGLFGHVLIIGGGSGMPGAAIMAGLAALRAGAGRVTVATRPEHAVLIPMHQPELMCRAVDDAAELLPLLEQASCIVLGPGLGQSDWARTLFETVIGLDIPMVLDADALNLLATTSLQGGDWVITPHPAEAARLLGVSSHDIQRDRFFRARQLHERYQAVTVLKGAGSLIASEEGLSLCPAGNPGMSTAGMGDILAGLIGGLVAQKMDLVSAAEQGVCIHARAGDMAAVEGERGMIATDLLAYIRRGVNL
jgi:ADP-dependent NAD(P)H-hydrate dehydratase / NAD(P)H-hydrate epimerase